MRGAIKVFNRVQTLLRPIPTTTLISNIFTPIEAHKAIPLSQLKDFYAHFQTKTFKASDGSPYQFLFLKDDALCDARAYKLMLEFHRLHPTFAYARTAAIGGGIKLSTLDKPQSHHTAFIAPAEHKGTRDVHVCDPSVSKETLPVQEWLEHYIRARTFDFAMRDGDFRVSGDPVTPEVTGGGMSADGGDLERTTGGLEQLRSKTFEQVVDELLAESWRKAGIEVAASPPPRPLV